MSNFKKDNQVAVVSRMKETTVDWFTQSWFQKTGKSYKWHLKALWIKDWIEISNFWKEFLFHTWYDFDIKESDQLLIEGVSYNVKGVSQFKGVSFSRLQCIIQKND